MLDPTAPSGKRAFPRANVVFDAYVLAKYITAPAIVVARNH